MVTGDIADTEPAGARERWAVTAVEATAPTALGNPIHRRRKRSFRQGVPCTLQIACPCACSIAATSPRST